MAGRPDEPGADLPDRDAAQQDRLDRLRRFLDEVAWVQVPPEVLGAPFSREESEAILGYGPDGV